MSVDLFGSITPTWTKENLQELTFVEDIHKDYELNKQYMDAGHDIKHMSIGLLQEHKQLPEWALNVKQHFPLKNITATIHRIRPSNYLPIHRDLFGTYKRIFNVTNEDIYRIIVFLEDWQPGHILDIDSKIYNAWKAGDYVGWKNDTLHAAYNFGLTDRFTLQITGTT